MALDAQPFEQERSLPEPDPSLRTMEALRRDIKAAVDKFDETVAGIRAAAIADREHAKEMLELNDRIYAEKLKSIETQFTLRDKATTDLDTARQTAIAAALQAQKELGAQTNEFMTSLIASNTANFTKLIDNIAALITTNTASITGTIDDLKGRLDRGEGSDKGKHDSRSDTRSNVGMVVGVAGTIFGFVSIIIAAVAIISRMNP